MYKISAYLLALALVGSHWSFGQKPQAARLHIDGADVKTPASQPGLMQSDPVAGYSAMREVMRWVQTKKPARVQIKYHELSSPTGGEPAPVHLTNEVLTDRKTAFTAHLLADKVEPGKKYAYDVLVMGRMVSLPYPTQFQTQPLWQ